jgi:hypothetical protein
MIALILTQQLRGRDATLLHFLAQPEPFLTQNTQRIPQKVLTLS